MRRLFLCALLAAAASAQEFEVVSVKPNKSGSNGSHTNTDQGRLTAVNVTLRQLIVRAYNLKDYQVEGPDWLGIEHFDISAKFPEALPKDPEKSEAIFTAMMQRMLADRFKLAIHRDQKTFAVYGLFVTKGGIKFREAAPTEEGHGSNSNNNHFTGTNIGMDTFANFLSRRQDLPVIDMTGLKGYYDLTLDWIPEPKQPEPGAGADASTGLTIPMALQEQLGLKLENRKAPIEILIVDHAEKLPTEN
jgi:uncharacterized protein (TIGR03435 family)